MTSQRSNSMEPSQDNVRKRVCKACDRCRLKKSKCDGASPCSRCRTDNAICVFGERKKSQDKVYPKGYVEMLEQQQAQLIAALRELYSRLQNGQSWPGEPLREAHGGHPLTHDILERLDLLYPSSENGSNYEGFEEDCNRMQQKLLERGATFTHRRGSMSSNSDHGNTSGSSHSGDTPLSRPMSISERPFARNQEPPTPPMNSPFPRQSQIANVKQEAALTPPTIMNTGPLDASTLNRISWTDAPMMMDDPMDFKYFSTVDSYNGFGAGAMTLDPGMVHATGLIPDWEMNDLDFANYINPVTT